MKWSEFLKKIGINLDEEVELPDEKNDDTDKKTSKVLSNENVDNNKSNDKKSSNEDKKSVDEIKEHKEDTKVELKFNETTGLFDLNGIEDESIKSVLTKANNYTINTANKVKIDRAFDEKMAGLKIRKGITPDAVRSLVKMDGVKVDGDKVVGLDEAFENLQKEQSGLFVQRSTPESNPMLEGFNPANNNGTDNGDALAQSLAALSASLGGNN